jgi:hypothetical protein
MLQLFLVAGLLSIALALVVVVSVGVGLVLLCFSQTRLIAPFVLFVPSLSSAGAGLGSWGLGYLAHHYLDPMSSLPFWAWIIGLLAGGGLGLVVGVGLAAGTSWRLSAKRKQLKSD